MVAVVRSVDPAERQRQRRSRASCASVTWGRMWASMKFPDLSGSPLVADYRLSFRSPGSLLSISELDVRRLCKRSDAVPSIASFRLLGTGYAEPRATNQTLRIFALARASV
jgi:hypothetical protein